MLEAALELKAPTAYLRQSPQLVAVKVDFHLEQMLVAMEDLVALLVRLSVRGIRQPLLHRRVITPEQVFLMKLLIALVAAVAVLVLLVEMPQLQVVTAVLALILQ